MNDKEIIKKIEETLNKKIQIDDKFIRYSFYELKVTENLNNEELSRFLELIKTRLENKGYTVLFTGARFTYQECRRTVQSNELMIAIKSNKLYLE